MLIAHNAHFVNIEPQIKENTVDLVHFVAFEVSGTQIFHGKASNRVKSGYEALFGVSCYSCFFAVKQIDISFSCVCPVIDHEIRHSIVKVAVDLREAIAEWIRPLIDSQRASENFCSYHKRANFSLSFLDSCVLYSVPFQAAQFAPIVLIILINFVIFILAIRTLNRTGAMVSAEKKSTSYHRVRTATAILILLGLTWAFGALAVSRAQLVFDYLFCIFNSLQGFLIFYFHCIRHQEVRNQWKWLLLGKGLSSRKTETDSRTGYPKTASRQNNYELGTPTTSLAPGRKVTVTSTAGGGSPTLKTRPDVIPAEV